MATLYTQQSKNIHKIWLLIAIFIGVITVAPVLLFPSQVFAEQIQNFDTQINVNQDASVNVAETIIYDFGDNQKHGIYRDIPIRYKTNLGNQSVALSDVSVTDENNQPYQFSISGKGNDIEIKIGNPGVLVSGVRVYVIRYTVKRVVDYFKDFDEIYWNATGNEWSVPILLSSAEVTLPSSVSAENVKISCYTGAYGSSKGCFFKDSSPSYGNSKTKVHFSEQTLSPGEGLTVAVGFPKGIVSEPTQTANFLQFASDNWVLFMPIFVFGAMFLVWRRYGRDPKGTGVIVAQYETPDGLTPMEISAIVSQKVKNNDLSAELICLATKGYVKIEKIEEQGFVFKKSDYILKLIRDYSDLPKEADRKLLECLFAAYVPDVISGPTGAESSDPHLAEVRLSDLKNKFFSSIPTITALVYDSLVTNGYYKSDPSKASKSYFMSGFLIVFISTFFGGILGDVGVASGIISGLIIILWASFMPVKTEQGVATKEYILGLKDYLQIAEKDRLAFHNAPEKRPEIFEKLLPFAMVLGVEVAWAKEFADIYTTPPNWYHDSHGGTFNSLIFVNSINSFGSSAMSTLSSAPGGSSGSGGGGFSGGGGGGGAGGSW